MPHIDEGFKELIYNAACKLYEQNGVAIKPDKYSVYTAIDATFIVCEGVLILEKERV
uniref:Uncharacterized protein n=1 Tax=viral metagenome TaxID=1070528 RepID=A0A6M3KMK5_9ZZZZ